MKNKVNILVLFLILIILLSIFIPIFINLIYKLKENLNMPKSYFSAVDLLSYIGSLLTLFATAILGYVSYRINNRLLGLEESKNKPCIDIILLTRDEYDAICLNKNRMQFDTKNNFCGDEKYIVNNYNGYNFKISNTNSNYIYDIKLKNIRIEEILDNGARKKILVDNIESKYICNINTFLKADEEKYLEIHSKDFPFSNYDYLRYNLEFILYSNTKEYKELIEFEVQNIEAVIFIRNKTIEITKCNKKEWN